MHTLDGQTQSDLPSVTWITPTYCRPQTLANLIACFEAQQYPADKLRLLILDDVGQYPTQLTGNRWEIISIRKRFASLPAKFNALAGLCESEIIVVAEDDDSFLPHHTAQHVAALQVGDFSKPKQVLSDYQCRIGEYRVENGAGRFHGSIAFRRTHWERMGGWPLSHQANFDQQMLSHFASVGTAVEFTQEGLPQYVFRWHTGHFHGQSLATGPGDTGWYSRFQRTSEPVDSITPKLDPYTERLYESLGYRQPMEPNAGVAIPGAAG